MSDSQKFQIGEAATYLGVSKQTLRRWEQRGLVLPMRTPTNHRIYTKDQLDELMG